MDLISIFKEILTKAILSAKSKGAEISESAVAKITESAVAEFKTYLEENKNKIIEAFLGGDK